MPSVRFKDYLRRTRRAIFSVLLPIGKTADFGTTRLVDGELLTDCEPSLAVTSFGAALASREYGDRRRFGRVERGVILVQHLTKGLPGTWLCFFISVMMSKGVASFCFASISPLTGLPLTLPL